MNFRRSTLQVIGQIVTPTVIAVLLSCGVSKSGAPAIVVTFDPGFLPPASLNTGAYAGIAADVANDNQNAGVTFACDPAGACGSFTPIGGGSAVPVCYLAPSQVPAGNTVTVTATSVTDPTKSKSATITIVSGAPNPCP
ncbi:MAG: hypothetical protein LAO30_08450 [Acidobacteriia bacterium]|nr:hypothetical protein [Terriglobia bacterium]